MPAAAVPAADVAAPQPSATATEDARPVQTRSNAAPAEGSGALAWVDRWFIPAAIGILLVATAIRLPELGLNPFHHDEGVNGWFTTNLVRTGSYFYDPQNYHGPSLYYLALASEILLGLTDTAMRLVPVVFGVLTVAIVLGLRPALGSVARCWVRPRRCWRRRRRSRRPTRTTPWAASPGSASGTG